MERLCLGKLSRAFVCSICSIGWSHRTVGNILKAELFLCFSWKSSKTMPSAIKPMTFLFYHWWNSYRESLQSCTQLNTDTSHNDVRKTIGQLPCWWQIMRSLGNYHELQEKKIPSLANTDECYKVSTPCAITCQHISEWIFHFRLWWQSWLSKYEFVPHGISVLHIC